MSSDKRLNRKLPERVRREDTPGVRIDSGPFIGIIKNNVDPIRAGRIQVWIPDLGGNEDDPKSWRTVSYASPFYGSTFQSEASLNNKFTQVPHSYGMWAVVPDIGNQVICTFIAGDANKGYWFACINPNLSHGMVPAIASGPVDNENTTGSIKKTYDPNASNWPVAEFNENIDEKVQAGWTSNTKPPHETQTQVLISQGLDADKIRGAVSSSSQRESPSNVFGISSPGRPLNDPKDNPEFASKLLAGTLTEADYAVRGRKGGHTFVMDDGDQTGASQLLRLRTAGGHQVLMNDSERVLYIANSDGSCWLEFTGAGHINMYSSSGINMRTEGEFNIHADQDININSGGTLKLNGETAISNQTKDFSIKAANEFTSQATKIGFKASGDFSINSASGGWGNSGTLILKGGKLSLNTDAAPTVGDVADQASVKQSDTSWNEGSGRWIQQADVYETIATIAPAHEPWTRSPGAVAGRKAASMFAAAPQSEKQTSVCAPPGMPPGSNISGINPSGSNNEALLESALKGYNITDMVEFAQIMAQCAHESGNFKFLKELGPDSYFQKYEGRKDLGNTQPGDGLKYKGRGFIQITGRDIYAKAGSYLGVDLINNPQLAEDPPTAAKLVLFFFFEYKKSRVANLNWGDTTAVTRIVNGGTNGLTDREQKFAAYKQKYTNGIVTTGSGAVLTDGSGNPVQTGSSKLDPGPEAAKGQAVNRPAPPEVMGRSDAPNPAAIASTESKIPGLIATQVKALMLEIGFAESNLDYKAADDSLGRLGCYKINAKLLRDYEYIKADAVKKYDERAVFRDDSFTGKDGINSVTSFLNAKGVQDNLMEKILNDYYTYMVKSQGIAIQDDVCTVGGMLATAYFFRDSERGFISGNPPDQAKFWREQKLNSGNGNALGCIPYNQGRYAIDILSIATASTSGTSANAQPPTVNINPDDVLNFTNRSGDRAHFDAATVDFKDRLLSAAKDYKDATGKKLTISSTVRTQEEQTKIYDGWVAAGGVMPSNPTVNVNPYGNISRPVKTVGNHGLGIAADVGTAAAAEMDSMGLLAKYGLYLFDPKGDPPHVQLKPDLRPPNLQTIQTL